MSKGVEKDVAADNTELKKQLHHHQPGLELFVNCLLRLNVLFFYRIEMSPMTMASGSWSATTKNSTNNSQLLGRSTHSVRLLVIYWPLLNEIPFTFSLSPGEIVVLCQVRHFVWGMWKDVSNFSNYYVMDFTMSMSVLRNDFLCTCHRHCHLHGHFHRHYDDFHHNQQQTIVG